MLVDDLVQVRSLRSRNLARSDIVELAKNKDKERLQVCKRNGLQRVRAIQGHSLANLVDDDAYTRLDVNAHSIPDVVYHGTMRANVDDIYDKGLIPGGGGGSRLHVHMVAALRARGRETPGLRGGSEVAVEVHIRKAMKEGLEFYLTDNNVYLTRGNDRGCLPVRYLGKAISL